jgi:molybdopterin-guanine dinucleotide biosynthesis protein A
VNVLPVNVAAGAILAGGGSRRMGRDKALVEIAGVAMARRVADALAAGGCARVLVIGGDAPALGRLGLEVVEDRWPGEGPLGGILTALDAVAASALVVACDLPWLDAASVAALLAAAAASDADAVVATTGRLEPLCAVWSPSAAAALQAAFDGGQRAVSAALTGLRVVTHRVRPGVLHNVNRPDDLLHGPGA